MWTVDQVLSLAADDSSKKSGRDLAAARKWQGLGKSEAAAWGLCQGSGKDPYQTGIDLAGPAFKCSCPSRKFPCKHGLGLFLILAQQPSSLVDGAPPAWLETWLAGRRGRAEKPPAPDRPPDPVAQARRVQAREEKVAAGLEDLERWLRDGVRQGLATWQGKPYSFFEEPARRLVDAQAPGLARHLRDLAGVAASGDGWQERCLEILGRRLYLPLLAYRRLAALSPETQADVRSLIGWNVPQEEVLEREGVRDRWLALGRFAYEDERLRVSRTWLWGRSTGRAALLLHFAAPGQPLPIAVPPGRELDAEVAFFPGAYPQRALLKDGAGPQEPLSNFPGYASLGAAFVAWSEALARNPWVETFPAPLTAVVAERADGGFRVRDGEGRIVPLHRSFAGAWDIVALSGGHPIGVFGELTGRSLRPLAAWAEGRFCPW